MDIGARLSRAIATRGSVRGFQLAMRERGVEGGSPGAIYRYLNDEVAPSVAFLSAAADVLGVAPEWLAFGRNGATPCSECAMRDERVRRAIAMLSA